MSVRYVVIASHLFGNNYTLNDDLNGDGQFVHERTENLKTKNGYCNSSIWFSAFVYLHFAYPHNAAPMPPHLKTAYTAECNNKTQQTNKQTNKNTPPTVYATRFVTVVFLCSSPSSSRQLYSAFRGFTVEMLIKNVIYKQK